VPVNLRRAGDANSLGNKFGLVPVLLPIGIDIRSSACSKCGAGWTS